MFVHKCAEKQLNTTLSFSYQSLAALRDVHSLVSTFYVYVFYQLMAIKQAAEQFPDLESYHDKWPVNDILRLCLKNTSVKLKCQE